MGRPKKTPTIWDAMRSADGYQIPDGKKLVIKLRDGVDWTLWGQLYRVRFDGEWISRRDFTVRAHDVAVIYVTDDK